jgi:hypothetical protein
MTVMRVQIISAIADGKAGSGTPSTPGSSRPQDAADNETTGQRDF